MLRPAIRTALLASLGLYPCNADAQEPSGVVDVQTGGLGGTTDDNNIGFRSGSVIVAPIPFSNPTIGSGLILGAGYLFTIDPESDPSVIGIAGLKSDNGSTAGGASINLAFGGNKWIIKSLYARADVRYDLFTDVGVLPIQQDGDLARLSVSYGVTPDLSFGLSLRYFDTMISPEFPGLPPIPPPFDQFLETTYGNVGLVADWDTRDDTIYPTTGFDLHIEAFNGYSLKGLLDDYSKAYSNYTHYLNPTEKTVVAARLSVCGSSSGTPFFEQCGLGTVDAFRGFSATQFLDFYSTSLQIEARQRLTKRIGMVAFAGTGLVGSSFGDLGDEGTHSAYGLGARYRVSKKFPLDFSVDVSRNDEQENNLYIYVGQRF
ncbi:hypothetical protein [Ruegeria sp. Ofav3-42]|uniref:hypothetical protein n=1 Tax=Ruegeria sp. Ofav3-42 TaxID=2917759 RepID=UPI001EF58540|nr:hypothetical protein [Ruegeria sp. Ofav3-42]MCG7518413.1 hypothetical protein [Ruegeria sp. Ofav3-42]